MIFASSNKELVSVIRDKATSYLDSIPRSSKVLEAMQRVDRANFLPADKKKEAYIDAPVPIGSGQTCSQPSMVAFMLDKLDIRAGDRVLEIGGGCGYAAAIASIITGIGGHIYTSEIIFSLAETLKKNVSSYKNITVLDRDGSEGFREFSPFNKIFLSAGVKSEFFNVNILLDQLSDGGILLYPETSGSIYRFKKHGSVYERDGFYGVSFVPLTGKNS